MNNQKDTKKTDLNIYGPKDVSDIKDFKNIPDGAIYEFANKKTEKLITALYMVTDCMDTDDALKNKLRFLGVELLSDIYKLSTLSPVDKHVYISIYLTHIHEILSFIEIAFTIGFISEMNTVILKKEFNNLALELKSHQSEDKHFTFTLDEKMFDLPEETALENKKNNHNGQSFIKDISKRTQFNTMSFINKKSPLQMIGSERFNRANNPADREDRVNKIISIVKEKGNLDGNKDGVSIKDISLAFTDLSEKTIQRELNSLVLKGQLKKTGSKRWSRYSLILNS